MSLSKILDYQKKDLVLYRREKELAESNEAKRALLCRKAFNDADNSLNDLKQTLDSYYRALDELSLKAKNAEEIKHSLFSESETLGTDEEYAAFEKKLEEFDKFVGDITKEIAKITKQISDVAVQNKTTHDKLFVLNREYVISKTKFIAQKDAFEKEAEPVRKQLEEITKDIDAKLLEKYNAIRAAKKMPAFVPFMDGTNCGACGMDIGIEVGKKLVNSGDMTECPHCGRIVYKI